MIKQRKLTVYEIIVYIKLFIYRITGEQVEVENAPSCSLENLSLRKCTSLTDRGLMRLVQVCKFLSCCHGQELRQLAVLASDIAVVHSCAANQEPACNS